MSKKSNLCPGTGPLTLDLDFCVFPKKIIVFDEGKREAKKPLGGFSQRSRLVSRE